MPKYYLPLCIARPQAKYLFIRTTQESLYPEKKKKHGWPVTRFWEEIATCVFRIKEQLRLEDRGSGLL